MVSRVGFISSTSWFCHALCCGHAGGGRALGRTHMVLQLLLAQPGSLVVVSCLLILFVLMIQVDYGSPLDWSCVTSLGGTYLFDLVFSFWSALPETITEVENHRFVEENSLPRGHVPLPWLFQGGYIYIYLYLFVYLIPWSSYDGWCWYHEINLKFQV